jgi:hypothetical protein
MNADKQKAFVLSAFYRASIGGHLVLEFRCRMYYFLAHADSKQKTNTGKNAAT